MAAGSRFGISDRNLAGGILDDRRSSARQSRPFPTGAPIVASATRSYATLMDATQHGAGSFAKAHGETLPSWVGLATTETNPVLITAEPVRPTAPACAP